MKLILVAMLAALACTGASADDSVDKLLTDHYEKYAEHEKGVADGLASKLLAYTSDPKNTSVVTVASANPDLSTLVAAVKAAGLVAPLSDPNATLTVLAPTDEAFAKLLKKLNLTAEQLLSKPDLLKIVLTYHVIPGVAAKASDLKDKQVLPTLNDQEKLTVEKSIICIKFIPSAPKATPAKVIVPDIPAGKAFIHVIDKVLVPGNVVSLLPAPAPKVAPTPLAKPSP